jgi:hypothetical protein
VTDPAIPLQVGQAAGHAGSVRNVTLNGDGRTILTGGYDGTYGSGRCPVLAKPAGASRRPRPGKPSRSPPVRPMGRTASTTPHESSPADSNRDSNEPGQTKTPETSGGPASEVMDRYGRARTRCPQLTIEWSRSELPGVAKSQPAMAFSRLFMISTGSTIAGRVS